MNYKVVGPPGTGKTDTLLNTVKEYVDKGTPLNQIGYFAFTRKAANEARNRYLKSRPDLEKKDTEYFRTLHSLAFRRLNLKEENILQEEHYQLIGQQAGVRIQYAPYEKNAFNGIFTDKSEYLNIINLAKLRSIPVLEQLDRNEHLGRIERDKLFILDKKIEEYKRDYDLIDFNDMILKFIEKKVCPLFKVVFIDEAQDLSPLQWKMVKVLQEHSSNVYVAGDDDQAIFGWAGADVKSFINFEAVEIPLQQSHRVPQLVYDRAVQRLDNIVEARIDKKYFPTPEKGSVKTFFSIDPIDLSKGDWYILARTNDLLRPIISQLHKRGIYFETSRGRSLSKNLYQDILNWEKWKKGEQLNTIEAQRVFERLGLKLKEATDKMFTLDSLIALHPTIKKVPWYDAFTEVTPKTKTYIRAMRKNGENLKEEPRVKVMTLHGSKGGEASNVIILQSQTNNTMKAVRKSQTKRDEEQRVWYVGITRTKHNLFLIRSKDRSKEFKI
jgi:DNA helicase-2/ATP-dependent DNA helicase PcrA